MVRAKGMYNSLPKSIQSLGLLVISAGPFHCVGHSAPLRSEPCAADAALSGSIPSPTIQKTKPTQGRFNFLVRAKGMYNSLPKSIQSLGLLVISAGPFHCVGHSAPLRSEPCAADAALSGSIPSPTIQKTKPTQGRFNFLVRAKGIEPSSSAWEADVLPLYHARVFMAGFYTRYDKKSSIKHSWPFPVAFYYFQSYIYPCLLNKQ